VIGKVLLIAAIIFISAVVIINTIKLNRLIDDCEKNLPRDQYCELVATPDKPKDDQ